MNNIFKYLIVCLLAVSCMTSINPTKADAAVTVDWVVLFAAIQEDPAVSSLIGVYCSNLNCHDSELQKASDKACSNISDRILNRVVQLTGGELEVNDEVSLAFSEALNSSCPSLGN